MRVIFKVNLGSLDAARFQLDFTKCQTGMELEVKDEAGEWLVSRGMATKVAPQPVLGVSAPPAIAEVSKPTIKAEPVQAKAKQSSHKES